LDPDGIIGMDPDGIIESNWDEVVDNFDDMGLREELLRGIKTSGFENPTAIQQRAIVPIIKGHDVIVQSPWIPSGRTAAVCIGALQKIDTGLRQCQVLVLTQTHELAQNIQQVRLLLCPP
jgi:translation initiation factor 4A